MRTIWTLFLMISTVTSSSGQKSKDDDISNAGPADNIYNYKEYNRFILLKSKTRFNSVAKITDFGQLPKEGNVYNHVFDIGTISDWEFIRVHDQLDNSYFYNIAYYILGFGDDDPNHADKSVLILTDKKTNKIKYLGLIDKEVTQTDDSMLLISDTNKQYFVDIPSHTYKTVDQNFNFNIKAFLKDNAISSDDFKDPIMVTFSIRFNEKASR